MRFWENVRRVLEARGQSVRWLALEVGVTPAAMFRYDRGSIPGLDVAGKIAQSLGMSLDLLMWGDDASVVRPQCTAPGEHDVLRELVQDFGLGDILSLANVGSQSLELEIIQTLMASHPEPVEKKVIEGRYHSVAPSILHGTLLALKKKGVIVEQEEGGKTCFVAGKQVTQYKAKEMGDISLHIKRAIKLLVQDVNPGLEARDGSAHLTTVVAHVPPDIAAKMAEDLNRGVVEKSAQYTVHDGDTAVKVVFAVVRQQPFG